MLDPSKVRFLRAPPPIAPAQLTNDVLQESASELDLAIQTDDKLGALLSQLLEKVSPGEMVGRIRLNWNPGS